MPPYANPFLSLPFPFYSRGEGNQFNLNQAIQDQNAGQMQLLGRAGQVAEGMMPRRDIAGNYIDPFAVPAGPSGTPGLNRWAEMNPQAFDDKGNYIPHDIRRTQDLARQQEQRNEAEAALRAANGAQQSAPVEPLQDPTVLRQTIEYLLNGGQSQEQSPQAAPQQSMAELFAADVARREAAAAQQPRQPVSTGPNPYMAFVVAEPSTQVATAEPVNNTALPLTPDGATVMPPGTEPTGPAFTSPFSSTQQASGQPQQQQLPMPSEFPMPESLPNAGGPFMGGTGFNENVDLDAAARVQANRFSRLMDQATNNGAWLWKNLFASERGQGFQPGKLTPAELAFVQQYQQAKTAFPF